LIKSCNKLHLLDYTYHGMTTLGPVDFLVICLFVFLYNRLFTFLSKDMLYIHMADNVIEQLR